MMASEKNSLSADLKRLQEIAGWFDTREEIDIEMALEKVKEAATLLKTTKSRLKEIENEFEVIKNDLEMELDT